MGTTAEKLTYLNTTKGLIKDTINYAGAGLTNEPFRQYPSKLYDKYLDILKNPNTLFNNMPQVTGTGTSLALNNTADTKMKMTLNPSELSQESTPTPSNPQDIHTISGDNTIKIINSNLFEPFSNGTISGLTEVTTSIATIKQALNYTRELTFNNGEITGYPGIGNGAYYIWNISYSNLKPNTTYTISFNYQYTNLTGQVGNLIMHGTVVSAPSGQTSVNGKLVKNFTTDVNGTFSVQILNINLVTCDTNTFMKLFNIMLVEGNYTSSTMPEYTSHQEQVLPLNLPVENLFDKSTTNTGKSIASDGSLQNNSSMSVSDYIKVNQNTNYYLSNVAGSDYVRTIAYYNSSKTFISFEGLAGDDKISGKITTPANTAYIRICYAIIYEDMVQVEQGTKANSYTPYGTTPLEYCKIGDYADEFVKPSGKNLLNLSTLVQGYYTRSANPTITGADDNRFRSFTMPLKKGTYTINFNNNANSVRAFSDYDYSGDAVLTNYYNAKSGTFTLTQDGIVYFSFRKNDGTAWNDNTDLVWLTKGSNPTEYEPYNNGKWYLKKNIGKVVFDGTQSFTAISTTGRFYYGNSLIANLDISTKGAMSNKLKGMSFSTLLYSNDKYLVSIGGGVAGDNRIIINNIYDNDTKIITSADLTSYLTSHNILVYYILATPTYTLLNDTLQEQLDNIENTLLSYQDQTNISQVNDDLPIILDIVAIQKNNL